MDVDRLAHNGQFQSDVFYGVFFVVGSTYFVYTSDFRAVFFLAGLAVGYVLDLRGQMEFRNKLIETYISREAERQVDERVAEKAEEKVENKVSNVKDELDDEAEEIMEEKAEGLRQEIDEKVDEKVKEHVDKREP